MPRKRKKNTILEQIRIEDFAAEGKSLARWEGKVVFVERTVPGDVVDIFLYKNKNYFFGSLLISALIFIITYYILIYYEF